MKIKYTLYALLTIFTLSACGGDDDTSTVDNTKTVDSKNINANVSTPTKDLSKLEFPRVKGGKSDVIIHSTDSWGTTYALEWDHELRAQRWTCFRIDGKNKVVNGSRQEWGDHFKLDPMVPSYEQPAVSGEFSKSYFPGWEETGVAERNASYQRGHICASADRLYDKEAHNQTYYMTNMMPMVGKFNAGVWSKMEDKVRDLADMVDTLYICKGGTIDDEQNRLGYTISGFIVPKYFFMAILGVMNGRYKTLGFWVEHKLESQKDDLSTFVVNIDELERKTGIDFFCNLPDETEANTESKSRNSIISDWNL